MLEILTIPVPVFFNKMDELFRFSADAVLMFDLAICSHGYPHNIFWVASSSFLSQLFLSLS